MKKGIHPKYYPEAIVKCACGAEYKVGSTKPYTEVEVCAKCHPFYTGREKIIDKKGMVQKFKEKWGKK